MVYIAAAQHIKTIVDSYYKEGIHEVLFSAGNLSSGVYYYNLKAAGFNTVKKMLLFR